MNDPTSLVETYARLYREGQDRSLDPRVREVAGALGRAIAKEFDRLPFQVAWTKEDPPGGIERVRFEVSMGTLRVFTGGTGSPILGPATNLYFRAVHDWDHVVSGGDFTFAGEVAAYQVAAARWPWAQDILFSEIVLQAADTIARGGVFGAAQKVVIL